MTNIPSSFSTLCTKQCKQELIGFLLSLSLHHPQANTYIICDTETKKYILSSTPQPKLNIFWKVTLDKYSDMDRNTMEKIGLWSDFQMAKADVIEFALGNENDTLFLDSDTIILDKLMILDNTKYLGVSPQFIGKQHVDRTGYYNGGMLWTNQKTLPNKWKEFTKTSRYYDQASIEDLTKEYPYFEFGENYNLQTWRFLYGLESGQTIASNIRVVNHKLYYKQEPLKFIHTHFNLNQFKQINDFFIQKMKEARLYKELAVVFRVINDKWVLTVPKQPINGLYSHNNDSYRELPLLYKINNKDVDVKFTQNTGHCWLEPNILMYDRPVLQWVNEECKNTSLILLGNGDINNEGVKLKQICYNVKPWIFWPRRPMIVEKLLKTKGILKWEDRKINSIFIGNFENSVQQKYRKSNIEWESVLDEYHCTAGSKHKFTQEEYLMKLRESKFGLCLRGYGSKCHREVELMAFGTVPVVTPEVTVSSYMESLIENTHYIKVTSSEELKEKLCGISQDKWEEMSNACYKWYQNNVHSNNAWKNMIYNILY